MCVLQTCAAPYRVCRSDVVEMDGGVSRLVELNKEIPCAQLRDVKATTESDTSAYLIEESNLGKCTRVIKNAKTKQNQIHAAGSSDVQSPGWHGAAIRVCSSLAG